MIETKFINFKCLHMVIFVGKNSSHKSVYIKSFCISQFPHKSVIVSFKLVIMKDELTDLCGN